MVTDPAQDVLFRVRKVSLPSDALLQKYVVSGDYTDCFITDLEYEVSFADYVEAFYTTAVFKAERLILKWLVARPSADKEARALADGTLDAFAAWQVEARADNQFLLTDFRGRTRSWLMLEPISGDHKTRLFFGSAVIRALDEATGEKRIPGGIGILMGFHKVYSRVLLAAARSRLTKSRNR